MNLHLKRVYKLYEENEITIYDAYKWKCKELKNDGKSLIELNNYENFKNLLTEEDFKKIIVEKQRRKNKRYRCDKKILDMIRIQNAMKREGVPTKLVFGTLTLNDKTLSQKEDTYIRKIASYLKTNYIRVILNKDYGDKSEREHYHFIGLTTKELTNTGIRSKKGFSLYNIKGDSYNLGHTPTLEMVNAEDNKQVRNYLLKLNNHSNKTTTKSRIRVYSNPWFNVFYEKRRT